MAQGNANNISSGYLNLPLDNTPIGTVIEFSGSTPPPDYLVCDGSAISRTTYTDLFTLTGTMYGSGDNSTTFNLPNTHSYIRRTNGKTRGSTNTNVIIYGTAAESAGTDITYNNSATLGDFFTINTSGIYAVSISAVPNTASSVLEIHVGSLDNVGQGSKLRATGQIGGAANYNTSCSWTGYIASNNVVWAFLSSAIYASSTIDQNQITITRIF